MREGDGGEGGGGLGKVLGVCRTFIERNKQTNKHVNVIKKQRSRREDSCPGPRYGLVSTQSRATVPEPIEKQIKED